MTSVKLVCDVVCTSVSQSQSETIMYFTKAAFYLLSCSAAIEPCKSMQIRTDVKFDHQCLKEITSS